MTMGSKILIVDDDRDLVKSLQIILEDAGYQVLVAYNACQGLNKIELERPDLILLDIMLPEPYDGLFLVSNLRRRSDSFFQKVPIVIVTAIPDKAMLFFSRESFDGSNKSGGHLPVQDFVAKPIEPNILKQKIKRILSGKTE